MFLKEVSDDTQRLRENSSIVSLNNDEKARDNSTIIREALNKDVSQGYPHDTPRDCLPL
jgi:hypothetical protein